MTICAEEISNVSLINYLMDNYNYESNNKVYETKQPKDWFYKVLKGVIKPLFKMFNSITYEGVENLEGLVGESYILTSNHRYSLDPFYAGSGLPKNVKIRNISKKENFETWFKYVIEPLGTICLSKDRTLTHNARKRIKECVLRKEVIGIYPEGTRHKNGLKEWKTGVVRLAAEHKIPYVFAVIYGKTLPLKGKVKIKYGKPHYLNPLINWDYSKYKQATREAREQFVQLMKGNEVKDSSYEVSKEEFNELMKNYKMIK